MKINSRKKDNPKLCQQKLSDGRCSLYLEYYLGRQEEPVLDEQGEQVFYTTGAMNGKPKYKIKHHRRKEVLRLYIVEKPRTQTERQSNKEVLELAERIRFEREQKFLQDREGYRLKKDTSVDLYDYFDKYLSKYTKKDRNSMYNSYKIFRRYIAQSEHKIYSSRMKIEQLTPTIASGFCEYLKDNFMSAGAKSKLKRVSKVLQHAVDNEIIKKNPFKGITIYVDESIKKDVLTMEEIKRIIETPYYMYENIIVRKAFIFSLFSGLRYCDVRELTFGNIDYTGKRLRFEQNKTKGHSTASAVIIPLSDSILKMIGTGERDELIFKLPSYRSCYNSIMTLMEKAGIKKHITWHCARHSFGTNLVINGANIKTVQSLMGHSSLVYTDKYVRAVDKLKEEAIKSLGDFEL